MNQLIVRKELLQLTNSYELALLANVFYTEHGAELHTYEIMYRLQPLYMNIKTLTKYLKKLVQLQVLKQNDYHHGGVSYKYRAGKNIELSPDNIIIVINKDILSSVKKVSIAAIISLFHYFGEQQNTKTLLFNYQDISNALRLHVANYRVMLQIIKRIKTKYKIIKSINKVQQYIEITFYDNWLDNIIKEREDERP